MYVCSKECPLGGIFSKPWKGVLLGLGRAHKFFHLAWFCSRLPSEIGFVEGVGEWKPCRSLPDDCEFGAEVRLGPHECYLGKDYFSSSRGVSHVLINLLTREKVILPEPRAQYELGIDDAGDVFVYDVHEDSERQWYVDHLFHAVMMSGGGTNSSMVMNMHYEDPTGDSTHHLGQDVTLQFKYADVVVPYGHLNTNLTFTVAAFDWNSNGCHVFWNLHEVYTNAKWSADGGSSNWVYKRMQRWERQAESELGSAGLVRRSREWSETQWRDDGEIAVRVLDFPSMGTPALIHMLLKSAFCQMRGGGGFVSDDDRVRAKHLLECLLRPLCDFDWELGLFLCTPWGPRHAPEWPETQNGDNPVRMPIVGGVISSVDLGPQVLAVLEVAEYTDFTLFEVVEMFMQKHNPIAQQDFLTQLSWNFAYRLEKRLMLKLRGGGQVADQYTCQYRDTTQLGLSEESDNRILQAHLDASHRETSSVLEISMAVDKARIFGKGLFDNFLAVPNGKGWFGPPLDPS